MATIYRDEILFHLRQSEYTMPTAVICIPITGLFLAAILVCLHVYVYWTQNENEPPVLGNSIPFITPAYGLLRRRTGFMVQLRLELRCPSSEFDEEHRSPSSPSLMDLGLDSKHFQSCRNQHPHVQIYTLRFPGSRVYIINAPSLIPSLQKQKHDIAFEPIPARAMANICGMSRAGMEIFNHAKINGESFFGGFLRAAHHSLAPGKGLESISKQAIRVMAASIKRLESKNTKLKVNLWHWVRHEMLIATTEAMYGPNNPFRCPSNEDSWYEFEEGVMQLLMRIHKLSQQGRSSLQARERLVKAFRRYYEQDHHQIPDIPSLCLVQACYNYNLSRGLSLEDIARTELAQVGARVSNTIPGAFWLLWHVFSDSNVLADCRGEIEKLVTISTTQQSEADGRISKNNVYNIDLSQLTCRQVCPIIMSTWYEVLRYNHVGISARVVMKDTFLGKYLLKKSSTTMIVSPVVHSDVTAWGSSACEFQHRRFIQDNNRSAYNETSHNAMETPSKGILDTRSDPGNVSPEKGPANRLFGGGSTLCPGRHLASQEVLSFLALTIMRFDLNPVNKIQWIPPKKFIPLPTALPIPKAAYPDHLEFEMVARFPERQWRVIFGSESITRLEV
ncbi:hypothetical protein ED733_000470 [Metarhizium rileyi]|uniref:Cytochrome P450 n=1 Tax=Metarhizium rileyi (strain RCEF 4871) TaxID=1649241 RepID=A0A5C6G0E8_METRR|nr:hypothetical protein ED733_000470 [Metarhizium rileyi]